MSTGERPITLDPNRIRAASAPYEPTGEVSSVTDPGDHVLGYHYDTRGRVRQIDDPDGGTSTTEYDAVGNVASTTNAREQQTSFGCDALDRLTFINYPDGEEDVEIEYRSSERQRWQVALQILTYF